VGTYKEVKYPFVADPNLGEKGEAEGSLQYEK